MKIGIGKSTGIRFGIFAVLASGLSVLYMNAAPPQVRATTSGISLPAGQAMYKISYNILPPGMRSTSANSQGIDNLVFPPEKAIPSQEAVLLHELYAETSRQNDDEFNLFIGDIVSGQLDQGNPLNDYFRVSDIPANFQSFEIFDTIADGFNGRLYNDPKAQQQLLDYATNRSGNALYDVTTRSVTEILNLLATTNVMNNIIAVGGSAVTYHDIYSGVTSAQVLTFGNDDATPQIRISTPVTAHTPNGYFVIDFPGWTGKFDLTLKADRQLAIGLAQAKLLNLQKALPPYNPANPVLKALVDKNKKAAQDRIARDKAPIFPWKPSPKGAPWAEIDQNFRNALNSVIPGAGADGTSTSVQLVYFKTFSNTIITTESNGDYSSIGIDTGWRVAKFDNGVRVFQNMFSGAIEVDWGTGGSVVITDLASYISKSPTLNTDYTGSNSSGGGAQNDQFPDGEGGGGGQASKTESIEGVGEKGSVSATDQEFTEVAGELATMRFDPPPFRVINCCTYSLPTNIVVVRGANGGQWTPPSVPPKCVVNVPSCPLNTSWTQNYIDQNILRVGDADAVVQNDANQCAAAAQHIFNTCGLSAPIVSALTRNTLSEGAAMVVKTQARDKVAPARFAPGLRAMNAIFGNSFTISVGLTNGSTSTAFRWYKDGVLMNPQPNPWKFTISSVKESDAGVYKAAVDTPTAGTIITAARLQVVPAYSFLKGGSGQKVAKACQVPPSRASQLTGLGWTLQGDGCYQINTGNPTAYETGLTSCTTKGAFELGTQLVLWACGCSASPGTGWVSQGNQCYHLGSISKVQNNSPSCIIGNSEVLDGKTIKAYMNPSVPSNVNGCSGFSNSATRLCKNGDLTESNSYSFTTCTPKARANCQITPLDTKTPETVIDKQSIYLYPQATGDKCIAENRVCENGGLSGMAMYKNCSLNSGKSCSVTTADTNRVITVPHLGEVGLFPSDVAPVCSKQIRKCNNGTLSGSARYEKCIPDNNLIPN